MAKTTQLKVQPSITKVRDTPVPGPFPIDDRLRVNGFEIWERPSGKYSPIVWKKAGEKYLQDEALFILSRDEEAAVEL